MKKVNNYFSHDYHARDDTKLKKLRMAMGMEGIGIYWCIVEFLYENDGYLTLDDDIEMLVYELRIDKEKLLKVIENFDLFKISKNKFFSQSVLNRLKKIEKLSKTNREKALKRWGKTEDNQQEDSNAEDIQEECYGIPVEMLKKEKKKKENKREEIYNTSSLTTTNDNIFSFIESNFGRLLSSVEIERVDNWSKDFDEDIIKEAFSIAVINGNRTFAYVNGILNNWKGKGLKSLAEVREDSLKFSNHRSEPLSEEFKQQINEVFDYNWLDDDEEDSPWKTITGRYNNTFLKIVNRKINIYVEELWVE